MSIKRWDAKGRTHEASQGSFVRFADHIAEITERDAQVRDMEAVISMQRADVKRLSADLAAVRASLSAILNAQAAEERGEDGGDWYAHWVNARAALAALPTPPKGSVKASDFLRETSNTTPTPPEQEAADAR